MKLPFLKCVSCSENSGDTQIKISSSCFQKPVVIKLDSNDNKELEIIQNILNQLILYKDNRDKEKEEKQTKIQAVEL